MQQRPPQIAKITLQLLPPQAKKAAGIIWMTALAITHLPI
jgi:hypothetical protein